MQENKRSVFETLSVINVNDKVEKKNGLTYLSWAWAWAEVKKHYPEANYEILETEYDPALGYMCHTQVTIEGVTHKMWLPVLDGANKPMKAEPYTYWTKQWEGGRKVDAEKEVLAANMFDINKTMMRCLVKNLAMFGLGLYIYAGEDLPEADSTTPVTTAGASTAPTAAKEVGTTEVPAGVETKAPDKKARKPRGEAQAPAAVANGLTPLIKGDGNWNKVAAYIEMNKGQGIKSIVQQLTRKYSLPPATMKEIETLVNP